MSPTGPPGCHGRTAFQLMSLSEAVQSRHNQKNAKSCGHQESMVFPLMTMEHDGPRQTWGADGPTTPTARYNGSISVHLARDWWFPNGFPSKLMVSSCFLTEHDRFQVVQGGSRWLGPPDFVVTGGSPPSKRQTFAQASFDAVATLALKNSRSPTWHPS